jgi:hypothetical protein
MTDRPIIFSAPMVRALLDGRKTQTRRVARNADRDVFSPAFGSADWILRNCRYAPGDRLYVREAHALVPATAYRMSEGVVQAIDPEDRDRACIYREGWERSQPGKWRPSIHMPRWASRITLTVTEVRVQRLQEISETDAKAEGVPLSPDDIADNERLRTAVLLPHIDAIYGDRRPYRTAAGNYAMLWNSLHGPDAWDANPWVVAVSFIPHLTNIDAPYLEMTGMTGNFIARNIPPGMTGKLPCPVIPHRVALQS